MKIINSLCCARTGSPCSTSSSCACTPCVQWLLAFNEGVEAAARELELRSRSMVGGRAVLEAAAHVRAIVSVRLCGVCCAIVLGETGLIDHAPAGGLRLTFEGKTFTVVPAPQPEISMPFKAAGLVCEACVLGYAAVGMLRPLVEAVEASR